LRQGGGGQAEQVQESYCRVKLQESERNAFMEFLQIFSMAFDIDAFIQTVIPEIVSGVVTGVILALVLGWWQSHLDERRQRQEFTFLIQHLYKAFCNEDYKEIYYFLKLATEKDKATIQQILQMELRFEANTTPNTSDIMVLGNVSKKFRVDFSFQVFLWDIDVKDGDENGSYYWFLKPESAPSDSVSEVFKRFQKYIVDRAKSFELKL
jgi:hypothetical protein